MSGRALKPEQVLEARFQIALGMRRASVASALGVTTMTLRDALTGRRAYADGSRTQVKHEH